MYAISMFETFFTTLYTLFASVTATIFLATSLFIPAQTQQSAAIGSMEQETSLPITENLVEITVELPETQEEDTNVETVATPEIIPEEPAPVITTSPVETIASIPTFYDTPPLPLDVIHTVSTSAVVNILCATQSGSAVSGATGSGIIIDPRGVILTNAHVAQYVLIKDHPRALVSCVIRTGAPAKAKYTAELLAFPYVWAENHGKDLLLESATGTGEHDWALLYITDTVDDSEKPRTFPFVSFDTRQAVTVTDDPVLLASYPAGFLRGAQLQRNLWPLSTTATIQKVYTFSESIVDILSLGGTIVAQGGSSGGAVINQWNKLVGVIVTSSVGDTTDERDLRAVTLSHIDTSIQAHTGYTLVPFLQMGNFENRVKEFKDVVAPHLLPYFPI